MPQEEAENLLQKVSVKNAEDYVKKLFYFNNRQWLKLDYRNFKRALPLSDSRVITWNMCPTFESASD